MQCNETKLNSTKSWDSQVSSDNNEFPVLELPVAPANIPDRTDLPRRLATEFENNDVPDTDIPKFPGIDETSCVLVLSESQPINPSPVMKSKNEGAPNSGEAEGETDVELV
jgi:hypothetical protein